MLVMGVHNFNLGHYLNRFTGSKVQEKKLSLFYSLLQHAGDCHSQIQLLFFCPLLVFHAGLIR